MTPEALTPIGWALMILLCIGLAHLPGDKPPRED